MIVGIAGKRGSGKTTLARVLVETHGYSSAAFGDVVRAEARRRGCGDDVPSLQRLGEQLIEEWGWERFCGAAVPEAMREGNVAVEGVRHRGAADGLRSIARGEFVLVFVELADDMRGQRLEARGAVGETGLAGDRGVAEREVESLREVSDLVVDGDDLDAAAVRVVELVALRRR